MNKKKNIIKIALIILIAAILVLGACIIYNKFIKKDDNKKESYVSKQGIIGFGTIEKQNKNSDESIDIVAYYKDGKIKRIYSFDKEYLKDIINEENIMYQTKNINISYDDDKLYIQINKRLYSIDLTQKEYELIDLGIDFDKNAEKLYVVDGIAYLNYSSHPSKRFDIKNMEITDLKADSYYITDFIIDRKSKSIFFTDNYDYDANIKQTLYYAPLKKINKENAVYLSKYNSISIMDAYDGNIVYEYYDESLNTKYSMYNINKEKTKKISIKSPSSIYILGKDLYYSNQKIETNDDQTIKNCTLKFYKYDKSKALYEFDHCKEGNYMTYIGNDLFELFDTGSFENNVVINTKGEVKDLYITDKENKKEKLDVTKYYNINYEYVEVN